MCKSRKKIKEMEAIILVFNYFGCLKKKLNKE